MENIKLPDDKVSIVESVSSYNGNSARMILSKSILIPKNTIMQSAPVKLEMVEKHYEIVIPIGGNNTARFFISEKAALALRDIDPSVTIF